MQDINTSPENQQPTQSDSIEINNANKANEQAKLTVNPKTDQLNFNTEENEAHRRLLDSFYLDLKRKSSDPAIRTSHYKPLVDIDETSEGLTSPPKDFRKHSLPLSLDGLQKTSISSPPSGAFARYPNGKNFTPTKHHQSSSSRPFQWTVNDEHGCEVKNFLFDSITTPVDESPSKSFCLHFEENFVRPHETQPATTYDELNEKFKRKLKELGGTSIFTSQSSDNNVLNATRICKKCGHDI